MGPRKISSPPILIGNCEVIIEAKNFSSDLTQNSLQISLNRNNNIKISVVQEQQDDCVDGHKSNGISHFVLVNPRDSDDETKALIQKILDMYKEELPAMNYAANTGKQTKFLEKCVSNGKYCTLLMKSEDRQCQEVVGAMTYQIIPSDTQHAEIPLAAVNSINQRKGIGHCLYMELKKRLRNVGIRTVFCWADQESEGFWIKQGFVVIGKVNTKGRANRLPIKTEIRKSLCFPGGSTLMVSHIHEESLSHLLETKHVTSLQPPTSASVLKQQAGHEDRTAEKVQPKILLSDSVMPIEGIYKDLTSTSDKCGSSHSGVHLNQCLCSVGSKKRRWDASCTSLNSKKIKGGHLIDCALHSTDFSFSNNSRKNSHSNGLNMNEEESTEETFRDLGTNNISKNKDEDCRKDCVSEHQGRREVQKMEKHFRIMLMDIADDTKKSILTKIIEELGGAVTVEGSTSTHVISGKVRTTLNFCRALCSGAWILSPSWLKESFRAGKFIDEMSFVLKDENYESKYKTELKSTVLRARANPRALLKGYDICIAAGSQPPVSNLSAITKSAGGNVIKGLDNVKDTSKTIFVACEDHMDDHMDDALSAVEKGIRTFGGDWFINCIMRQELSLEAPQYAESL
ncbi:hypothetical protein LIER_25165 [Lithospermum erythrorhizon]|uniref:BRCT domain-containing protein n=1 Tax=Lithospermum erythrorhizon TaxID=34254 RepID=A0AAV3R6S0_LITER